MSSRNKTDVKKLFEFWCEVAPAYGVNADRSLRNGITNSTKTLPTPAGIIVESFPENFRDEKAIHDIPVFAYPCELDGNSVQSYSFVLTTDDSKWRFGFCRHDPKTETAIVIITYLPWHDTFLRLLTVLAELRRTDLKEFKAFLSEAYNRGVPEAGGQLKLFYNGGQSHFVFERPAQFQLPSIPENHNLNLYYNFVEPKNMIAVFAAMLAERRIIFTSRRLDRLSSCIQAANAFLYPMVWQHIFIPVLPMKLKDYLSAPMPYLIGVPETVLETMTTDELGEVVILNCDTKIFDSQFDDVHALPSEIVQQLKKQLSHPSEHMGDRVSKIFLGVLVQLIGGYRDAVEFRDTGKTFNRDKFIESRPSHLRPFLTKMMDLQIFQQFIDERLEMLNTGLGFSDEFEMETVRYAEKMKKRSKNMAFLKNVKDKLNSRRSSKTNPAVKSAVKSVKEGSRGMKTAYKDLKSKFRDITPPSNPQFRSHIPNQNSKQHDYLDGSSNTSTSTSASSNTNNGYIIHNNSSGNKSSKIRPHHSAPSSPIFTTRSTANGRQQATHQQQLQPPFQYAKPEHINGGVQSFRRAAGPNPLAMSSSAAHIQSNGYASNTLHPNNHNNHLVASPTVSPPSSLCSSEMNLSQELQNHPLFKTPIVDRSLKPSLDQQQQKARTLAQRSSSSNGSTTQAPTRPPPPIGYKLHQQKAATLQNHHSSTPPTYYNHPYATQAQAQTQPPQQNLRGSGRRCRLQQHPHVEGKPPRPLCKSASTPSTVDAAEHKMHTSTPTRQAAPTPCITQTTDSSFDTPPDMQSPPIPPRRQSDDSLDGGNQSTIAAMAATVSAGVQQLEQNCWQDYDARQQLLQHSTLRSSSSSNTSTVSSASLTSASSASNTGSASTAALSSSFDSSADSYRTAESHFSHAQLSRSQEPILPITPPQQQQQEQPPVPAPRQRKDKESLRSLQPHYMQANTMTGSIYSMPSCASSQEDTTAIVEAGVSAINDLISLDDSHNTSFDLEDFDPLNQNARPMPPLKGTTTTATNVNQRATTLPILSTNENNVTPKSIQNPLYHYYVPPCVDTLTSTTLKPPTCKPPPPPLPETLPPNPASDDDFELLRKYGLDQFTLTATSGVTNASATATGMSNWTTFD